MDPFILALLWALVGLYFWQAKITRFSSRAGFVIAVIGTIILGIRALGPFV